MVMVCNLMAGADVRVCSVSCCRWWVLRIENCVRIENCFMLCLLYQWY